MQQLNFSLCTDTLPRQAKDAMIAAFWGLGPATLFVSDWSPIKETSFDIYFKYYSAQCDLIGLHDNGQYSSLETHENVAKVAALLQQNQTWEEVLQHLSSLLRNKSQQQHENTICLVSRLLVMMRIGDVPHELSAGRYLDWKQGTLRNFVHNNFSVPSVLGHERIKFEKTFNALSLRRVAGIDIRWTDNLADHLRLMNDDTLLCVFHHVAFLQRQQNNSMFPSNFACETLQTLALLFPKYDKKTRKWYEGLAAENDLDPEVMECGHLFADERQIESFQYWHDRLVVLKQVYDESRPSTISQWWHDRRNSVQWYTFWVAIVVLALTILFGLIQIIEGALQVYKAFHPV